MTTEGERILNGMEKDRCYTASDLIYLLSRRYDNQSSKVWNLLDRHEKWGRVEKVGTNERGQTLWRRI